MLDYGAQNLDELVAYCIGTHPREVTTESALYLDSSTYPKISA